MGRIVVIGGLNMDIHLFGLRESAGQAPLVATMHLAQPGGKGGNASRAAARLGARVTLVARVGDDDFGRHCVDAVAEDGVDISGVHRTPDRPTGFVAIQLDEGKHRSLVFSPGANDLLSWGDVEPSVAGLGPADLVLAQAEVPPETLTALAAYTVERGIPLYLDPTPPDRVRREHLAAADVITPDLAEAAQLTGRRDGARFWPEFAARELHASGARRVLVKTGEAGALLLDADGLRAIPTIPVDVVDETGAGDVFAAALAVRRLEGADWDTAVRFANAAAALSVSAVGMALPAHADVVEAVGRLGPTVAR